MVTVRRATQFQLLHAIYLRYTNENTLFEKSSNLVTAMCNGESGDKYAPMLGQAQSMVFNAFPEIVADLMLSLIHI